MRVPLTTTIWLCSTIAGAAPTAPPESSPLEERRVALACSVSARAGELGAGVDDVTAIRCEGRPGFFVPSTLYRSLRADEGSRAELELERVQVQELRAAVRELTRSASAASSRADLYHEGWDEERRARLENVPSPLDHPGVWIAVGAVLFMGVLAASR